MTSVLLVAVIASGVWAQDATLVDKDPVSEKSSQTTAVAGLPQTRPWRNSTTAGETVVAGVPQTRPLRNSTTAGETVVAGVPQTRPLRNSTTAGETAVAGVPQTRPWRNSTTTGETAVAGVPQTRPWRNSTTAGETAVAGVPQTRPLRNSTTAGETAITGVPETRPWRNSILKNSRPIRPIIGNLTFTKPPETVNRKNISQPVNPNNKVSQIIPRTDQRAQAQQEDSETLSNRLDEKMQEVLQDVTSRAKKIIRPAMKMFSDAGEFKNMWPEQFKVFYNRLRNPLLRASQSLQLTSLTENNALRLLKEITYLPLEIQIKLTHFNNMADFSNDELKMLPTDIIPALTENLKRTLPTLPSDKTEIICNKLMESTSHPGNLRTALKAGIKCAEMLDKISNKRRPSRTQASVLIEHIRKKNSPSSWTYSNFSDTVRLLGSVLSADDYDKVPEHFIRKSLKDITRSSIPQKSIRQSLVKKMFAEYSSPSMWPQDFLETMGSLLDEIPVQQLALLLPNTLVAAAPALTKVGIHKESTRKALVKNMARALRAEQDPESLARIIPWMKEDLNFMKDVNLTSLLEALSTVNVTFTDSETNMVAARIEKELTSYEEAIEDKNDEKITDAIAKFVEGFDLQYLESIPVKAFPDIRRKIGRQISRSKSKLLLRKLKVNRTLSATDVGVLFNGVDLNYVNALSPDEIISELHVIRDLDLPPFIGRNIVNKIVSQVFRSANETDCHNGFHRLGNLARYVRPRFIVDVKVIPISIGDEDCDFDNDDVTLTKAQAYALVDNIREALLKKSLYNEWSIFTSLVIERLGKLVIGLTADDIHALPLDTDLLTVTELLSEYENDLDYSQVEAVVTKIREYFDITHRNELTDVDDIVVLQIGRFLQYLNSDFELSKFPRNLHPQIFSEIGKSSLLKIPGSKRRTLFTYGAKRNTEFSSRSKYGLMHLGSLRCDINEDDLKQLAKDDIETHIEDMQNCPWKEKEAQTLAELAVNFNVNILYYREHMATSCGLLLHLKQSDLDRIHLKELAETTGCIARTTHTVQETIHKAETNGFIRERTSEEHDHYNRKRRQLVRTGFLAMNEELGTGKCHQLMTISEARNDVADLLDMTELERCIDYIGNVEWNPDTARSLLTRIAQLKNWGTLDKRTVRENSDYIVDVLPKLIIGLTKDEISDLDLSSQDAIASVGDTDGFTEEKLEHGFENWLSHHGDEHLKDLTNLQAFTCGASADFIKTKIPKEVVRDSLDVLGKRVRKCNRNKLNAYAEKVSSALGDRPESWKLHDIAEMGSLIGGLSERHLSVLTNKQIKVIEPDVITHMPPEKVKEFTVEQLGHMTSNQVRATTTMQRSYMSTEQLEALGLTSQFVNGGVCTQLVDFKMITLALAMLRQLLVFFEF